MPSIEALEKLLAGDPRDTFVLYGLGQAHAKEGRHAEAIRYYDGCLEVDPNYCYAYYHKARSQVALGDADAARATLEAGVAVARATGNAHALSELLALLVEQE